MGSPILHRRDQIDFKRWDECISSSRQRRIYAYTWWLDIVTEGQWMAIVNEDYSAVMPLPIERKWKFVQAINRPFLTQQLGIYYRENLSIMQEEEFFRIFLQQSKWINITIHGMHHRHLSLNPKMMQNHTLDLQKELIYNRLTNRNIKKALNANFHSVPLEEGIGEVLHFIVENMPYRMNKKEQKIAKKLLETANQKGILKLWLGKDNTNTIRCSAVSMLDLDRVYFLLIASDKIGIQNAYGYALIDEMIRYYKTQGTVTFDFTGSNMANIARRNLGFGADIENYLQIHRKFWSFSKMT
jgi:hypothetical protein